MFLMGLEESAVEEERLWTWFSGDIVVLGEYKKEVQDMLVDLNYKYVKHGMETNVGKSKFMVIG